MIDIDKALLDPAAVFKSPEDLIDSEELAQEKKIELLKRWEFDARELQVPEEENMIGNNADILDRIMRALLRLDKNSELDRREHSVSSKQCGDPLRPGYDWSLSQLQW